MALDNLLFFSQVILIQITYIKDNSLFVAV